MRKKALITGITGQDGSYLAEFLLDKGYSVHGLKRRSSLFNTERIDHIFDQSNENSELKLHFGDLGDASSTTKIIKEIEPDEIYNLGAQSHVMVSFETPEYTANVNALGTLRLLEAIRLLGLDTKTRFYQASSSELFGLVQETPQTEKTPFYPRSPYAAAKLYAHWITINYREAYDIFACNGILYNHESPRRGETFVTRKITRGMARVALGLQSCIYLGNLDAKRDWGHAKDYVEMQWLMLQQERPSDYVISTGQQSTVRKFAEWSAKTLGIEIKFEGKGLEETGIVMNIDSNKSPGVSLGQKIIKVDKSYFRPTEVDSLLGNSEKAKDALGWAPKISAKEMCQEMTEEDYVVAKRQALLEKHGMGMPSSLDY